MSMCVGGLGGEGQEPLEQVYGEACVTDPGGEGV